MIENILLPAIVLVPLGFTVGTPAVQDKASVFTEAEEARWTRMASDTVISRDAYGVAHVQGRYPPIDGRTALELKTPYRDGTTYFLFDPATFLERLAVEYRQH